MELYYKQHGNRNNYYFINISHLRHIIINTNVQGNALKFIHFECIICHVIFLLANHLNYGCRYSFFKYISLILHCKILSSLG